MVPLALVAALLFGWDVLQAPPRDLASLLNPRSALEQLGVGTEERALIALLERAPAPPAPTPGRPPADIEYVKRLLAMRRLGRMRSKRAVPAIRRMSEVQDPTLREMATRALAVLGEGHYRRPSGKEALQALADMAPADACFALTIDTERGSRAISFRSYFERLKEHLGKGAEVVFPGADAAAGTVALAEEVILRTLSLAGNVRVDSLAIFGSPELSLERRYLCVLVKGFWDPARVRRACAFLLPAQRQVDGQTVFYAERGPAVCVLDGNTAVVSVGPGQQAAHIEQALKAIAARGGTALPPRLEPAFKFVTEQDARLGVAGALTAEQRAELKREAVARLRASSPGGAAAQQDLRRALLQLVLALAGADMFAGKADAGGPLLVSVSCTDAQAALSLNAALGNLEDRLRAELFGGKRPVLGEPRAGRVGAHPCQLPKRRAADVAAQRPGRTNNAP